MPPIILTMKIVSSFRDFHVWLLMKKAKNTTKIILFSSELYAPNTKRNYICFYDCCNEVRYQKKKKKITRPVRGPAERKRTSAQGHPLRRGCTRLREILKSHDLSTGWQSNFETHFSLLPGYGLQSVCFACHDRDLSVCVRSTRDLWPPIRSFCA